MVGWSFTVRVYMCKWFYTLNWVGDHGPAGSLGYPSRRKGVWGYTIRWLP